MDIYNCIKSIFKIYLIIHKIFQKKKFYRQNISNINNFTRLPIYLFILNRKRSIK